MPAPPSDNLASPTSAFAQLLDGLDDNNLSSADPTNRGQFTPGALSPSEEEADIGLSPPTEAGWGQATTPGKELPSAGSVLPPAVKPPAGTEQAEPGPVLGDQTRQIDASNTPKMMRQVAAASTTDQSTDQTSYTQQPTLQPQPPAQTQAQAAAVYSSNHPQVHPNLTVVHPQNVMPPATERSLSDTAAAVGRGAPANVEARALDLKAKSSSAEQVAAVLTKPSPQAATEPQPTRSPAIPPPPLQAQAKTPADAMSGVYNKVEAQVVSTSQQTQMSTAGAALQQPVDSYVREARIADQTGTMTQAPKAQSEATHAQLDTPQPRVAPMLDEAQQHRGSYEPRRNLDGVAVVAPPLDPRGTVGVVRAVADMRQSLNSVVARQSRHTTGPAAEASAPAEAKLSVDWIERVVNAPSKTENLHTGTARHTVGDVSTASQATTQRSQADAVYDQVMRAVTRQALQQGKLNLQLTPRELGSVDIEFSTERGELQVAIVAREHATRDLLDQSLPRLRQSLQDAGINLGEVEVRHEQSRQQHAGTGRQQRTEPQATSPSVDEQAHTNAHPTAAEGRLNIYV